MTLLPLLLCAAPAQFMGPGDGVTLLARVDEYHAYNDVWGYDAPNGKTYAILGTDSGTAFYDVSVPSAPVRVGFVPGPASLWRDMKTYGDHCYVVTEGGAGVQAISLANPANPVLVRTFGTSQVGHSHNVAIDEGTGLLYACGTPAGMRVFDLAANPTNPPLVATYTAQYVHDAHVQHGRAHLAEINVGRYRIVSVNSLPAFPVVSATATPGTFTHNAWADEFDALCATTDESSGGDVTIYDISNPSAPAELARISPAGATVHNVILRGGRAYISTYSAGFTCWDLANPSAPEYVGRYDTSAYTGAFTVGNWGVYPAEAAGLVFASDIDNGLFVLRVDGKVLDVLHSPLGDTADEQGPYTVAADLVPTGVAQPVSAKVFWRLGDGAEQKLAMTPTGGAGWSAAIPGQASPALLSYRIEATVTSGAVQRSPRAGYHRFDVGERATVYFNGFEGATDEGWSHVNVSGGDDWERGQPRGVADDPDHAASGLKCWGTDLGEGTNGKFLSGEHCYLESPAIDCSGRSGMRLRFARWLSVRSSTQDRVVVSVNGTPVWQGPPGGVTDDAWIVADLDVSALADGRPEVRVRFELDGGGGIMPGGWNLDDFELYSLRHSGTDTMTLSGPAAALPGQPLNYALAGAPALARAWLLASATLGATSRFGHVFDLADPVMMLATAQADALGAAGFAITVPAGASGRSVHLEAAARVPTPGAGWADSNFLTLSVQ